MPHLDLGCAESVRDPTGYFAPWMERGDVHWSDVHGAWAVIGHDAVARAFSDGANLSADRVSVLERVADRFPGEFRLVVEMLSGWMIFRDPPEHTRLRVPVRSAFTSRRVHDLHELIEITVDRAMHEMLSAADDGIAELTEHVARPVPALVIGTLLGVDDADRHRLQAWSDDLASIVFTLTPAATPADAAIRAARSFHGFFDRLVARGRSEGGDGLIARIAELDDTFSANELVGLCTMLLFAGHETTTSLIQNMAAILLEQPALAEELRAEPELLGTAVDEFLRSQGPARTMVRKAAVDHQLSGAEVRAGDKVFLSIAAANHDPRVFEDPATIDVGREPNPHLGFGWGLHHCLGAQLARLEAEVVLGQLLERFPSLEPAGPVPPLTGAVLGFSRGPVRLRVPAG